MVKLVCMEGGKGRASTREPAAHRASATEGEAAKRLLESQGYAIHRTSNGQHTLLCPFHEGPGAVGARKSPNFYINAETSVYTCHSASCAQRGNLRTLERFFGIDGEDTTHFVSKDSELREFEKSLPRGGALREPFYRQGLDDVTIERFRLGFDQANQRYVIPYLEARRPRLFRYYRPGATGDSGDLKYYWEKDARATLFNPGDGVGDENGRVFICEGEIKAMLLCQLGYAAVAVPGATIFKPEWQAHLSNAKEIIVCFDSDNPAFHIYDPCQRCPGECEGHNPGQEWAAKAVDALGWRARNVVLPLPDLDTRKTDINEYFMRDGWTNADFAELALGERQEPFRVQTLADLLESPPPETNFLVGEGILPTGGRLLVAGKPKVGKSLFINNLALSIAAGIPFLNRYKIDHPARVLLLDRELSRRSLFDRLKALIDARPGYRAAVDNLHVDHDHILKLDRKEAFEALYQLVRQNRAEVVIFDTAYKFFGNDVESSSALSKAFEVLDRLIHETGCSVVMTHHHKKSQGGKSGANNDYADPDNVAGSFLWTGWPNATILLNYLDRSVENPFNAIATFTAFRDAAPPEPLALHRDRTSIAYGAITNYTYSSENEQFVPDHAGLGKPSSETVGKLLLEFAPVPEEDFIHLACAKFGVRRDTLRPFIIDLIDQGHFERTNGRPPILKHVAIPVEESWEHSQGLGPANYVESQLFAENSGAAL